MADLEEEMRCEVKTWAQNWLASHRKGWKVEVFDTPRSSVSALLYSIGLNQAFPASDSFQFSVDITGVLKRGSRTELAFVVVKPRPICVKDIGPLLMCCRLALPTVSIILSAKGMSRSLNLLLNTYNRIDLLEYGSGKRIKVGTWDNGRKQVDPASVIPPGELG